MYYIFFLLFLLLYGLLFPIGRWGCCLYGQMKALQQVSNVMRGEEWRNSVQNLGYVKFGIWAILCSIPTFFLGLVYSSYETALMCDLKAVGVIYFLIIY